MIDSFKEELLDLPQACKLPVFVNPRTKRPLHISGIYRHIKRGARGPNGDRIRLEVVRTPTGLRTSREAVARFITYLNERECQAAAPRSAMRNQQIKAAEKELADAGFELAPDNSSHLADRPS